jgi:hypothetical protein
MCDIFIWGELKTSGQAEVADFEFTIRVNEQISGFEVSMDHAC